MLGGSSSGRLRYGNGRGRRDEAGGFACPMSDAAPKAAAPKVTVIVVTWNRRRLLEECLESLRGQTFQDFETIVVDNASDDGTRELLESRQDGRTRVIRNTANRGFCAANNQGIRAARGEFVALLNNDAAAEAGWLAALAAALDADPAAGMAASKIVRYDDPQIIDKTGHTIYFDGQNHGRGTGARDSGRYEGLRDTAWPDGCAALYRRAMFNRIGAFDEDFFAYADDAELGLRARIAGWTAVFVPEAVVRHRIGSSLGQYSLERLYLIERNRIWLAAKLFPLPLFLLNPVFTAFRCVFFGAGVFLYRGGLYAASRKLSIFTLLKCLLRAHVSGLLGLPRMLAKRKEIERLRKLNRWETVRLLWRYRITLRELVAQTR